VSEPLVNAMTQAIEGQNLYHGRYGTTPAGSATARAILAHLRDLGWTLAATPAPLDGLQKALRRQHLEETHRASGSCPGWTCPTARVLALLMEPKP
jgi:hypothetical protein